jgi:two-component system, NarL family, invasion response regulator UvrY
MVTVLIADDHSVVRAGLKQIVADQEDMVVGGEAKNGAEVLALVRQKKWDIVVLDITMPGRSGLDILKDIKTEFPQMPVLMLSMHPEDQYALRALRAGASGYLTKESAPEELVVAIRRILKGRRYITESVAEVLAEDLHGVAPDVSHYGLSDREFQVLTLLAKGKSLSDIAEQLSLSVKTISTYRARLLQKMKLKNNAELIHYAISNHLA